MIFGDLSLSTLWFLAGMGLLFFLPPFLFLAAKLSFRLSCAKAWGSCVRIEKNDDPEAESTRLQPVIQFTDRDGRALEHKTGVGHGLRFMPRVGERVKLYYRVGSEPLVAQVAGRGMWQTAGILMLVGLVLMLPLLLHFIVK